MNDKNLQSLFTLVKQYYGQNAKELYFHGWNHVLFVYKKAKVFAQDLKVNSLIVQAAALVHDIEKIANAKTSTHQDGQELRKQILQSCAFTIQEIEEIESIIVHAGTSTRTTKIPKTAKALSDADTLFKALPLTPIFFSIPYLKEKGDTLESLASRNCRKQNRLMQGGFYFYSSLAKEQYMQWAKTNLTLWNNVVKAFEDPDIKEMFENSKKILAKDNFF